ncbi:hypothetical protein [Methylobacterium bullatum]|uniref:hypothetical protein n=1 Tax=Methylobacterium bullatum TaxID=570505 RepID=UPI0030D0B011
MSAFETFAFWPFSRAPDDLNPSEESFTRTMLQLGETRGNAMEPRHRQKASKPGIISRQSPPPHELIQ